MNRCSTCFCMGCSQSLSNTKLPLDGHTALHAPTHSVKEREAHVLHNVSNAQNWQAPTAQIRGTGAMVAHDSQ